MERHNLGDGYYFTYENAKNGLGGFRPINLTLCSDETGLKKNITDGDGYFINFPGVVDGDWREDLTYKFIPKMRFTYFIEPFNSDGLLKFIWVVQPDGMYYADEDGFGMENDVEIELVSYMDKNGNFTVPFFDKSQK